MKGYNSKAHARYIIETYQSPILETMKKPDRKTMLQNDFIRFLKDRYPDFDKKEISNAKTKEDFDKVANKYMDDFNDWRKSKNKQLVSMAIDWGLLIVGFSGVLPQKLTKACFTILMAKNAAYWIKELKKGF